MVLSRAIPCRVDGWENESTQQRGSHTVRSLGHRLHDFCQSRSRSIVRAGVLGVNSRVIISPARAPSVAGRRRGREPEPCRREAPEPTADSHAPKSVRPSQSPTAPENPKTKRTHQGRRTEWMPPSEDDGPLRRDASAALVALGRFGGYVFGRSCRRTGGDGSSGTGRAIPPLTALACDKHRDVAHFGRIDRRIRRVMPCSAHRSPILVSGWFMEATAMRSLEGAIL